MNSPSRNGEWAPIAIPSGNARDWRYLAVVLASDGGGGIVSELGEIER